MLEIEFYKPKIPLVRTTIFSGLQETLFPKKCPEKYAYVFQGNDQA